MTQAWNAANASPHLLHLFLLSFSFMGSLGTVVSFFSQKVKEKLVLMRELSVRHSREAHGKHRAPDGSIPASESFRLKNGVRLRSASQQQDVMSPGLLLIVLICPLEAFRSVRSMVEAELKAGAVDFTRRTDSGCRTLLRLHRSLLWLKLMLEGLADRDRQNRTPGELSR